MPKKKSWNMEAILAKQFLQNIDFMDKRMREARSKPSEPVVWGQLSSVWRILIAYIGYIWKFQQEEHEKMMMVFLEQGGLSSKQRESIEAKFSRFQKSWEPLINTLESLDPANKERWRNFLGEKA